VGQWIKGGKGLNGHGDYGKERGNDLRKCWKTWKTFLSFCFLKNLQREVSRGGKDEIQKKRAAYEDVSIN